MSTTRADTPSGPSPRPWFGSRPGESVQPQGLALVVVDRDRDALDIRDFLRGRGYRTVVRVGGREALAALDQEEPALILLDCWNRAVDPLAVLGQLANRPNLLERCLVVRAPTLDPSSDPLLRRQGARAVLGRGRILEELDAWTDDGSSVDTGAATLVRTPALEREPSTQSVEIPPPIALGPGLCIADRFVLERQLGKGATATVYLARDTELMDHVAIKVMQDSQRIRSQGLRFRREARVCRRLQHPNIVRLFEFGSWRGLLYLTMEYVRGHTLRQVIDRNPQGLPVASVMSIAKQATAGLVAAHAIGIAHRDIKPGNLMLLHGGAVKVMDFGLAKGESSALDGSDTRWVVGTPHYLAPERLKGAKEPCISGDAWSLGVVLYEALAGDPPFESRDLATLMEYIMSAPIPHLKSVRPDLPDSVCDAVMCLLSRNPADRPADLAAMARHFGQLHRQALHS